MALVLKATGSSVDAEEVRRAMAVLADPSFAVELRGVPSGRSRVLPGTDLEGMAAAAEELSGDRYVFFAFNPIPVGAPRANAGRVVQRRWLFIDVDSVKDAAHKDDPATDAEKAASWETAWLVVDHLAGLSWPAPLVIDSGNGWHLYYRVDLPNDEESRELVRGVLYALAAKFDGPAGEIDRSVHNADRLGKVPGTMARKGTPSTDRPHRRCRIRHMPATLDVVTPELLRLAGQQDAKPPPEPSLSLTAINGSGGGDSAYWTAALERECGRLAMAPDRHRNKTLNTAAFRMGQLLAEGVGSRAEAESRLNMVACQIGLDVDPDCGPRGIAATIKSGLDSGILKPRKNRPKIGSNGTYQRQEQAAPEADGPRWVVSLDGDTLADGTPADVLGGCEVMDEDGRKVRVFAMHTLGTLVQLDFPEPNWVVPGVMSEGLNILAGAPKLGKSMLALNLAMTVAGGGKALGDIDVSASDVLYLSLEDKQRRVKSRALKMLRGVSMTLADQLKRRLTVVTDWPKQDEGGLSLLEFWCKKVGQPGLVIIDVWGRFAPAYRTSGSSYSQDYDNLAMVKKFADRHGLTVMVIMHTRKPPAGKEPDDYVAEISGTMGLSGVADGLMVLLRSRDEEQARLCITGRDVPDKELVLTFNKENLTWKSLGTSEAHIQGHVQQAVVNYLRGLGGQSAFGKDIADQIGEKEDSVRQALNRLRKDKIVRKVGNAWVYPAGVDDDQEVFE